MEMPYTLKTTIEKKCSTYKQPMLVLSAKEISDRYRNESGQGKRLVTGELEALTYAVVRMPATFGAVSSALKYAFDRFNEDVTTVIDVGAGTGAATWAINELHDGLTSITCIEREPAMISLGKELMSTDPNLCNVNWIRSDITTSRINRHADIVVASYVLNELEDKKREEVLQELWDCTDKVLVIVEPGTPVGFGQLRIARKWLITQGGFVVAPCPHNNDCQIGLEDWCHFTTRISRSRLHKLIKGGDAPYEDEKYTFLAVSKKDMVHTSARVLRHPYKEAGRITLKLCTADGIVEKTITKKQGDIFKKARKANCGDSFTITEREFI